jgi:HPr kinase/phosphorylase
MSLIHATCVAIAGDGVIIRGPSGAGKSDLGLRLIDRGAELVADDYCEIAVASGRAFANAPANLAGKIEVRGFGIITLPFRKSAAIGLVVDLLPETEIERMPATTTCTIEGVTVRRLTLNAFAASAPAKIRLISGLPL